MPENSESVVDLKEALKFTAGDPELLRATIGMFLEEGPRQLQEVQERVEANDGPGTARAAHQLKGSIVIFGAQQVVDTIIALEQAGIDRLVDHSAWDVLQNQMQRLFDELKKISS